MTLVRRRLGSAKLSLFLFLGKGVAGARAFGEDGRPSERSWNSAVRATGAVVSG